MSCAWEAPDAPTASGMLFVLVVLADHASDHSGEDWAAWPSIERICRRTGLHRATVQRHLEALQDDGWISRKRRVRPDGTLGVYDYTIHRHADVRGELRAVRREEKERAKSVSYGDAEPDLSPAIHVAKCDMDPDRILSPSMSHFVDEPCRNLRQQEPLEEPLEEPSQDAREPGEVEPGSGGFEEAFALWPIEGQRRTNIPEARASFALVAGEIGGPDLANRVRRYVAEDETLRTGKFGAPSFARWLSEERWRVWAAPNLLVDTAAARPMAAFSGPEALRAAIVTAKGKPFAASYLDYAQWIAPNGLRPATRYAADKLRAEVGHVLRRAGVEIIEP